LRVDVLKLARELSERGEAYVLATVVWRRAPTSGQLGSRALITSDGRISGWVGGACAEPAVVAQAELALAEGAPRLLFLGTPEELAEHHRKSVVLVPIACQSEGALEVYVEPVLPPPHLVVIGRSPTAEALAGLGSALGWKAVLVDAEREDDFEDGSGEEGLERTRDLDAAGIGERSFVVVATQGHYDEEALERALATPAAYVGLIASHKRAEAVKDFLRDRGVPEEQLQRVRAPAGLDLGSLPAEEIGVAVLAEIVQIKALVKRGEAAGGPRASVVHEAVDPVCGMTVKVSTARYRSVHDGRTYYFCSAGCLGKFEGEPPAYVGAGA
jgi:xanthine dehydrogenase accessory factor